MSSSTDEDVSEETADLFRNLKIGKSMLSRVSFLENHFGKLCYAFSDYSLKCADVRDKNDELAQIIARFSYEEHLNTTSKLSLKVVAELIASIADHRYSEQKSLFPRERNLNAEVKRIEAKVIPPLASYRNICKHLRTDIKSTISSLEKENTSKRDVYKMIEKAEGRNESGKGQLLVEMAEGEYEKNFVQSTRLQYIARDQMIKFETKRIQDMKESLTTFLKIELAMHAKSMELLTEAYKYVQSIDDEADLNVMKAEFGFDDQPEIRSKPKPKLQEHSHSKPARVKSMEKVVHDWSISDVKKRFESLMSLSPHKTEKIEPAAKVKTRKGKATKAGRSDSDDERNGNGSFNDEEKRKQKKKAQKRKDKQRKIKVANLQLQQETEKTSRTKKVSFQNEGENDDADTTTDAEEESTSTECCSWTETSLV